MRGRKPTVPNVVPLTRGDDGPSDAEVLRRNIRRRVSQLMPQGLSPEVKKEWRRVATILAEPTCDRLKERYVDTIREYCVACVRLRQFREAMPTIARELYNAAAVVTDESGEQKVKPTRNGIQIKSHPFVAQMNETWRQWRSLMQELGLSPAAERNLMPGQGDLFDATDQYFN